MSVRIDPTPEPEPQEPSTPVVLPEDASDFDRAFAAEFATEAARDAQAEGEAAPDVAPTSSETPEPTLAGDGESEGASPQAVAAAEGAVQVGAEGVTPPPQPGMEQLPDHYEVMVGGEKRQLTPAQLETMWAVSQFFAPLSEQQIVDIDTYVRTGQIPGQVQQQAQSEPASNYPATSAPTAPLEEVDPETDPALYQIQQQVAAVAENQQQIAQVLQQQQGQEWLAQRTTVAEQVTSAVQTELQLNDAETELLQQHTIRAGLIPFFEQQQGQTFDQAVRNAMMQTAWSEPFFRERLTAAEQGAKAQQERTNGTSQPNAERKQRASALGGTSGSTSREPDSEPVRHGSRDAQIKAIADELQAAMGLDA